MLTVCLMFNSADVKGSIMTQVPTLCHMTIFRCQRAANSVERGRIWPNFKLTQARMYVIITCKYAKGSDQEQLRKGSQTFFFPL